jgi:hypothetical protein
MEGAKGISVLAIEDYGFGFTGLPGRRIVSNLYGGKAVVADRMKFCTS